MSKVIWHKVKDGLPPFNKEVLLYSPSERYDCGNGYICNGIFVGANTYLGRDGDDNKMYGVEGNASYWAELPDTPGLNQHNKESVE